MPRINPNNSKPRALVVDDEPMIVVMLSALLSDNNYEVLSAESGEAALQVMQSECIDVLVTDIRMDGMTGFELIDHTRSLDSELNVIVITAHDGYDMIKQALSCGAYDYLTKPLENYDSVVQSVNRAARATRLARDNSRLLAQLSASHEMLEDANQRLRELNDELLIQANTDALTGLYNRRHIDVAIDQEIARRNRYPDPLSLVMLDVDLFKAFNDLNGHEGGDLALKKISELLMKCARNTDIVGRFGGEEFIVILPKTEPVNAMIFADRVRRTIETSPINIGNVSNILTASLGVTGVSGDHPEIEGSDLLLAADRALYVSKENGRNCVSFEKTKVSERRRKYR